MRLLVTGDGSQGPVTSLRGWVGRHPSPTLLVGGAVLLGVALLGVLTRPGQVVDAKVASLLWTHGPVVPRQVLNDLARPTVILVLAAVAAVLWLRALGRGYWVAVLTASLPLVLLPVSDVLRDRVIVRPDLGVGGYPGNTLPSGHATAALALLVGVVVLVWAQVAAVRRPGRPRKWLWIGIWVVIVLTLVGNVAWYAHRPADVLASAGLAALASGVLTGWRRRWPARLFGPR